MLFVVEFTLINKQKQQRKPKQNNNNNERTKSNNNKNTIMSVPTAFCVAGGGFTSLSTAMGFANAFHEVGYFDLTTHLGGISGGNWYQSQFIYSKEFYESVTSDNITEAVSNWGIIYEETMKQAIDQLQLKNITATVGEISPTCAASYIKQPNATSNMTLEEYWEEAFTELQYDTYWPASNYLYYITQMLDPWISNSLETSFMDGERLGYDGDATLVVGMTLGPDIYSNDGSTESKLLNWQYGDFVPVRFTVSSSSGDDDDENDENNGNVDWWYLGIDNTTTHPALQISQGSSRQNKVTVDLPLNVDASIAEIAAGSGSAFGQFGSPTLFKAQVKKNLASPELNLTTADQFLYFQGISQCLPWGLQNISSQLLGVDSGLPDDSPTYRWLDGAFSGDSTSVPATVAQIQRDCKDTSQSRLDCTAKPKITVMVPEPRDAGWDTVNRLFGNCPNDSDCNQFSGTYLGDLGYNLQIFEESIPGFDDPSWTLYSNHSYDFGEKFGTTPYLESWIWHGDVTTIDNPQFGIEAGLVVDFVCFYVDYPPAAFIIWPGYEAGYAWSTIYAQLAQEQADGIKSLLLDSDGNEGLKEFFGVQQDSSSGTTTTESPVYGDIGPPTSSPNDDSTTTPESPQSEDVSSTPPPDASGSSSNHHHQQKIGIATSLTAVLYLLWLWIQ